MPAPAAPGPAQARLLVFAAALLFSTGGAAIKFSALSSAQIAGLRSGVAAIALAACMPSWRPALDPRVLAVALAYAATLISFVAANTLTTAANTIFLQSTAPLYVLLLGPRLLGESSRRSDAAIMALIGAGLALIFAAAQPPLRTAPDPALGNWVALASGAFWALTLMGLRWLAAAHPGAPQRDLGGSAVVTGNILALLLCAPGLFPLGAARTADWAIIAYLGIVQIALAYLCLVRGVRGMRAVEFSLLLCTEPVLSALWAWALHGERPGAVAAAGCALIVAALAGQALQPPAP